MNWYDKKEEWYAPMAASAESSEETKIQNHQKPKGRIVGLVMIVLLCVLAIREKAQIPWNHISISGDNGSFSSAQPDAEQEELPESFSDFFNSYYTQAESAKADVRIERLEESVRFSPEMNLPIGEELSLTELYEKCASSIVSIEGHTQDVISYSWGTGVILSSDGIVLTNTHVIDNCDNATVVLPDGSEWEAKLIGADAISDLALLKIEAEGLCAAELGDSSRLKTGERVAAIGNPLGKNFTGTLTDGIISAIERDVSFNGRSMTLLQTNAALNEGNSGGALFNLFGQVVGITNMKMMSSYSSIEGIGFAIPSSTVCSVTSSLVEYGEVKGRPSIGITVGEIPQEIGEHYQIPEGLYIAAVSEGSDAEKQGICVGDILIAVDGVSVTSSQDVVEKKNSLKVGDKMSFTIWRNGETMDTTITLMDTNDIYQ